MNKEVFKISIERYGQVREYVLTNPPTGLVELVQEIRQALLSFGYHPDNVKDLLGEE